MDRVIKFRAYDKKAGEWTIPTTCTQGNKLFVGFLDREDVVVMQYTGLKDSQGKEIYEGDIVEFNNTNNKKEYGVVKWNKTGFDVERLSIRYFPMTLSRCCRIIGNIYDNPELLK